MEWEVIKRLILRQREKTDQFYGCDRHPYRVRRPHCLEPIPDRSGGNRARHGRSANVRRSKSFSGGRNRGGVINKRLAITISISTSDKK